MEVSFLFFSLFMQKIDTIISACLLGIPCRYSGKGALNNKALEEFLKGGSILVCPEIMSGQTTPRSACEIIGGDGESVLKKKAKIVDIRGKDYSEQFIQGAKMVIDEIVVPLGIKKALLKKGSPSCGVCRVYDGSFTGKSIEGCGVLVALLKQNHVKTSEM